MVRFVTTIWLLLLSLALLSQNASEITNGSSVELSELSYADQLLALEEELDSLSIFNLLDSVLLLAPSIKSEFNVRYGFTSSVTSAGRDFNINQTGHSFGASYFHRSGKYLDISGYWNSSLTPTYNPTILSAGYLGSLSQKWGYSLDYEHWAYNPQDSSENPLTNSLGTSLSYDFKVGFVSIDYSYLFGKTQSHRFITSLASTISLGKWWVFDRVNAHPTVSIFAGNGDITTLRITTEQISAQNQLYINRLDSLSNLSPSQLNRLIRYVQSAFDNGNLSRERRDNLISILTTASSISDEELAALNEIATNGIEEEQLVDGNEFGILNYSFTLPISFATNRVSIILSYTYSIPVKLPGEFFDVEPVGYFGASFSYRIPFK